MSLAAAPSAHPVGVGVGLRRGHLVDYLQSARRPAWVEVVPEAFAEGGLLPQRALDLAVSQGVVIPHGVSLNLGGDGPAGGAHLDALARFADRVGAPYYSDHVCASAAGGVESFDLIPLPFCEEAAEYVAARARRAREVLARPLVLENITWYARMPGSAWSEGRFLREVLRACDGGLLLDVANVVVNARNHGLDARAALESLPLERTVQIHLAGHRVDRAWGMVVDDHASAVSDETLALYAHALRRIGRPVPTLVEWDQRLPAWDTLLDEAERVAAVARSVWAETPAVSP